MEKFIPLCIPNFEGNERKYVDDAIDQGWVSTGGQYITKLEHEMEKYLNVSEVAACQSGTAGIHLSLVEAGIAPGDIVIVPTLTFIAAVNPVKYQFANPVFMDCDESLCMDPVKLRLFCEEECNFSEGKLVHKKSGKVVKAVIVVHVFGNLADMEAITAIADKYNLVVIEDATEALGSESKEGKNAGKMAGTIGDYGVFSFNGNKIITTGGGGAVTAKDPVKVEHIRYLSTQAKDDTHFYIHNEVGFNYRMTNIQAALGVAQMEELEEFVLRKRKNYDLYVRDFDEFELGIMVRFRLGTDSNKWFYSLEINMNKVKATMREIVHELETRGIGTRPIWGLIHEQLPYKNELVYKIEKAVYYSKCILNLPCSTNIKEEDIDYVVEQVKDVLREFC